MPQSGIFASPIFHSPIFGGPKAGGAATSAAILVDNTANGNTLTNYQVRVNVTYLSGMQADFSDLRLRDADDATLINHWVESYVSSTSAVVWVKIPSIPASSTKTIYLHYGDVGAAGGASGIDTFLMFEDFADFPNPTTPISNSYPMVMEIGGTYYQIVDNHVSHDKDLWTASGLAETWVKHGTNPAIARGGAGTWDDARVTWGSIGKEGATYYMYYVGETDIGSNAAIGLATSPDLITWTKDAGNPIIPATTDGPELLTDLEGNIVKYNNKYWLGRIKSSAIWLASADNIAGPWVDEASAAISVGAGGAWDDATVFTFSLTVEGGVYYIFYQGSDGSVWKIGYATASAPSGTWTKSGDNPVLSASETWENGSVLDPVIRKYSGTYYLFYTGNASAISSYNGYATASAIGGPYTKNPTTLVLGGTSPTIASGVLALDSGDRMVGDDTYTYKAVRFRANFEGTNGDASNLKWIGFINNATGARTMISTQRNFTALYLFNFVASSNLTVISTSIANAYNVYEIRWKSGETKAYIDDVLKATSTSQVPTTAIPVTANNFEDATNDLFADWIVVREYSDPEPTASVQ